MREPARRLACRALAPYAWAAATAGGGRFLSASGPETKWWWNAPARRMTLKTQYPKYTCSSVLPKKCSEVSRPTDPTAVLSASLPNAWWPCISPSATNTTPLTHCSTAAMHDGPTAALDTCSRGVNTLRSGSPSTCTPPKTNPESRPHTSMRSATRRAALGPPFSARFSTCGTSTAAIVDSDRSTMPPSCHSCMVIACAAAAVPDASRVRLARVTARNVKLRARDLSCTARPPMRRGLRLCQLGGRNMASTVTSPRLSMSVMYAAKLATSDAAVASAAPATPRAFTAPKPKMSSGSSTTLSSWLPIVILRGVTTSMVPRKAANAVVVMMAGTKVRALMTMYGTPSSMMCGSALTMASAAYGRWVIATIPATPIIALTNTASPTFLCSSALSPFAAALATSGDTSDGRNDMTQKALL
mmetsp:Transcript_6581/g.23208  ORF Transcript_6581/g.23208 Transcript_6581/m.23208 type:complete len:416 (+) Transcript_6581:125-1372(+)